MKPANIQVYPNPQLLAEAAVKHFIEQAHLNISVNDRFNVALSGGSTPKAMHQLLADKYSDLVDWSKVNFYWGDERSVPPEHPDSNYGMAKETLLDHIDIEPRQVHRIEAALPPEEAAYEYIRTLRDYIGSETPNLDLIFLGMGDDGHTASLFPHTTALQETENWVVANQVEKLDTWRITLTAPFINQATQITFLVAGENKALALKQILEGPHQPELYPSQLIQPVSGQLLWLLDQAAASRLESPE
ncbi:MAG: 6-phosphogluconolactonase [Chloroflexi bacterium]|nr:MAG: 6-phosphogluconolactonase [Chloroflexota bacterium]MBL1193741.1 6-phosphogluconolactonase [Chloroflexota bacterium]NOH11034.1 6-phosphogluconolactonase [Chloroflexota bacterium]